MIRRTACLLAFVGASAVLHAQEAVVLGAQEKSVRIVRAHAPPEIDGVLDDAVWSSAAVVDDLHEIQPTEYAEPSERTVVYILYDENALYIGARLYDRDPRQVTSRIMRQGEQVFGDDWFEVDIDPFHDRRSGYRFLTNPNGLRQEGLFRNVTETEWEWQGIWYAAGSIDEDGWVAEIEIPLKSISFDPNGDTWGINFRRAIARRDERIGWVSRNRNTDPSTSGVAVGFEGLQQGLGLDIVPSISATQTKTFAAAANSLGNSVTANDVDPSLDVFYKITPSLTSAVTVNTDFSATDVDARQVNLTRFGLFFPEKRDFFLQDADIFEFGSLDENGRPFFSRSVGLSPGGDPVDLEAGAKLTGRVGRFNLGALAVRQDEFAGVAADNALVARVSANLLTESAIGLIATEGNPASNLDNSLQGVDFVYRNSRLPGGRSFATYAWAQQSDTEGLDGDDRAYGFRISAPNSTGFRGGMRFSRIEQNFNPGLGFVNNRGIRQLNMGTEYTHRPTTGLLRSVLGGVNFELTEYLDGGLQSKRRTLRLLEIESRRGDALNTRHHWRDEVLITPFEISEGIVIPAGAYSFRDFNLDFQTADQRRLWGGFDYRTGPFFGGDRVQAEVSLAWRPSGRFLTSVSYETNDIHLPQGAFITRVAQLRTEIVFSSQLSWVTLVQYDNVSEVAGINSRVHWIPEPGREAFLVLNHNVRDLDRDNSFESIGSDAALKFNYTFRF